MKFEKTQVYNFEGALRGMRNPLASWHKSDSTFGIIPSEYVKYISDGKILDEKDGFCTFMSIGPNDLDLAMRLCKAGPEHRKFLRQIQVCVDITAPLYW